MKNTIQLCSILFFFLLCVVPEIDAQDKTSDLSDLLKASYTPGISLSVIEDGKITGSYALGYKSMDSKSEVTERTVFSAASLSKCIFSYIVLELNRQGKIDLDIPLMEYFTYEDIKHDERALKVTGRMVLSHNTGLPNWRNGELNFRNDPGSNFGYSGEGFVWLQRTVEHITGSDLESLAQKMVFQPLAMTRSSYTFLEEFEGDYALPHNNRLKSNEKYKVRDANAAHSLQTTSSDYAKFMLALVDQNNQLIHEVQDSVSDNALGNISWGLGVGLQITEQGKALWHWGDNGTFKAYFTIDHQTKDGVVYFTNGSNGLAVTQEIVKLFLKSPQPAISWNDYAHYKSPSFKFPIHADKYGIEAAMKPFLTPEGFIDSSKVSFRTVGWAAWQWLQSRELDLAGPLLLKMKNTYPDEPRVPYNTIRLHLMQGHLKQAFSTCNESKQSFPDDERINNLCNQLITPTKEGKEFFLSGYQNARMVSVVGPLNNWEETSNICLWEDGAWRCHIDLEPGEYEYKFRVDGVNILDPSHGISRYKDTYHVSVLKVDE